MNYKLCCISCNAEYTSGFKSQICKRCNGVLEVVFTESTRLALPAKDFWSHKPALPKGKYDPLVVGDTEMVQSRDHGNLFLKLEIQNPTRSFKDRGSVIEVGKAREYGYKEIVCASTGNMAYSLSYYARIYGIRSRVFIIAHASPSKLNDIRETGCATLTAVRGDFSKAQDSAINYYRKHSGSFITGDYCYRKEGQKTVAYEIIRDLPDVDYIFVPVGNATLLSGVLEALEQMKRTTKKRMPKVVAVQSSTCSPLVKAFHAKKKVSYEFPRTRADAIAVGFPTYGDLAIKKLVENGGTAIEIPDSVLEKEQKDFHRKYGLVAELASMAGIAAFKKLKIPQNKKCVAIITGGNV